MNTIKYSINNATKQTIKNILSHGKSKFNQPYLYHFTSHIYNSDNFKPDRLIENLKRKLKKEYREYFKEKIKQKGINIQNARGCPEFICFYSIEYKKETRKRISGNYQDKSAFTEDYLHIHIYLLFNVVQGYLPSSIPGFVIVAMNKIDGLRTAQYHKRANGQLYHNLNKEFEDAIERSNYLAKTDQKSSKIPYRKTFGHTRIPTQQE